MQCSKGWHRSSRVPLHAHRLDHRVERAGRLGRGGKNRNSDTPASLGLRGPRAVPGPDTPCDRPTPPTWTPRVNNQERRQHRFTREESAGTELPGAEWSSWTNPEGVRWATEPEQQPVDPRTQYQKKKQGQPVPPEKQDLQKKTSTSSSSRGRRRLRHREAPATSVTNFRPTGSSRRT